MSLAAAAAARRCRGWKGLGGGIADGWPTPVRRGPGSAGVSPSTAKPSQRTNRNGPPHSTSANSSAKSLNAEHADPGPGAAPQARVPEPRRPFPETRVTAPNGTNGKQPRCPSAGDAGTKRATSTPWNSTQPLKRTHCSLRATWTKPQGLRPSGKRQREGSHAL